ncbi:hypothetical protein BH10CYA1_BH10CYA1_27640 [soil metagenome]
MVSHIAASIRPICAAKFVDSATIEKRMKCCLLQVDCMIKIPPQLAKQKITVWHDAPVVTEEHTTHGATIEFPDSSRQKLWYKVPAQFTTLVTASADPFVVGSIFLAMERSVDLVIHGQVSPSLLRNLIDFQNAWFSWCPDKYGRGEISADIESETEPAEPAGKAICAFSSGLDSWFTIYRHHFVPMGRQKRDIAAALLIQGFDISTDDDDAFKRLTDRSRSVLNAADIPLITISTNFKQINPLWIHSHGAGLVSSLMLFQKQFTEGLIASTYPLSQLLLPWGSNPLTDPYLTSRAFAVVHDAAHWPRIDKLQALANWPEAYDNLSVCYSNTRKDENCCRCGKCVMTMLLASICQLKAPKSFPVPLTAQLLLSLRDMEDFELFGMDEFIPLVRASSLPKPLVDALARCIKFNQRRSALQRLNAKTGWTTVGKVVQRLHKHAGIYLP